MRLLGKKKILLFVDIALLVMVILLCSIITVSAQTQEPYQVLREKPRGNLEDYIAFTEEDTGYETLAGDCLWSIAEKLWGSGDGYMQLAALNADVLADPDLIYPGMVLNTGRNVYMKRPAADAAVSTPEYRFGMPDGWRVGSLEAGDAYANLSLFDNAISGVACLIRDKEEAAVKSMEDWEACKRIIVNYVRKKYAECVSDLSFEHYQSEAGEDIWLYSYVYEINLKKYGYNGSRMSIYVCQGIKQTAHIQAEFTGFYTDDTIQDIVRYMTVTFEELPSSGDDAVSVNASNMTIAPSSIWNLSGIHNPFAWVEEYFDAILCEVTAFTPAF